MVRPVPGRLMRPTTDVVVHATGWLGRVALSNGARPPTSSIPPTIAGTFKSAHLVRAACPGHMSDRPGRPDLRKSHAEFRTEPASVGLAVCSHNAVHRTPWCSRCLGGGATAAGSSGDHQLDHLMHKWITVFFLMAAGAQAVPAPHVQFSDPDRRAKLGTAFADIDRMFAEFAKTAHVPGAAWGIVIDGELAHSGAAGVREVATNAPVDADTVFRIASMTKSFTAMSILKLRDEGKLSLDDPAERYVPELKGLRYPTTDSPRITIRHLLTHSEGFPEDNPWGDQQLSESEAAVVADAARRHSVFECARHRIRILELRVRDPRTSRVAGVGQVLRRVRLAEHPSAARHDVDDAASVEGAGEPAGGRVSVGRRALEGRAGAPARVVRRDGRHADVDPRLEPLRIRPPRGVAAAGRAGRRPDPPGLAPRNAAALASLRHARRARQIDERNAPDVQRLRVWPRA